MPFFDACPFYIKTVITCHVAGETSNLSLQEDLAPRCDAKLLREEEEFIRYSTESQNLHRELATKILNHLDQIYTEYHDLQKESTDLKVVNIVMLFTKKRFVVVTSYST